MFTEPVVGEKFFGREEVLDLFNKRVLALKDGYRQNIALTGQSLSGKSSIILHFLSTMKDEGFVPIYVEVIRESFQSFADKFIATMLYGYLLKSGEEALTELDALLDKAKICLPKTHASIKSVYSLVADGDLDEAYMALLGLTSILKEESGFSSIVILDEFDNLEHLGVKNPFLNFGKVIMVQKDTMYIVSSSRNEAIKKIISEKLSLLFGNFEVIKVSNFDERRSAEYMDTILAGYAIDAGSRRFVIDFTDGNPHYLGRISAEIKRIAEKRMSAHIDAGIVSEAVLNLVYRTDGAIYQYLSNYTLDIFDTRSKDACISAIAAISGGRNKQADISRALKMKQADAAKILLRLTELGIVSKNGVFYKVDDRMLAFWVKNVYQRRKKILIDGTLDRTELYLNDIRSIISSFLSAAARTPEERVTDLFNQFANDMVRIDSKNLRLPHFTKVETKYFGDSSAAVIASFRGSRWIAKICENPANENDIISYIRNVKSIEAKMAFKIILALKGMDENSKLLAKELKIAVWDAGVINMLLDIYGRVRMAFE